MTIVVTGVSRGLGYAMAEEFVARGHTVCGCARSEESIRDWRARAPKPHCWDLVNVDTFAEVAAWAKTILELAGPPDLLINNAAVINRNLPLWEVPQDEFSRLVDINLKGTFHVIRVFVPAMVHRKRGVFIYFSSGWGRSTSAEVAPYCASKWAIEGLTQSLASELPEGMAAVALNPGVIDTDMLRSCFGESAGGFCNPKQWAKRAVAFLLNLSASDNGQPLAVP